MGQAKKMCERALREYEKATVQTHDNKMLCYEVMNHAYQLGFISDEERDEFLMRLKWGIYND